MNTNEILGRKLLNNALLNVHFLKDKNQVTNGLNTYDDTYRKLIAETIGELTIFDNLLKEKAVDSENANSDTDND